MIKESEKNAAVLGYNYPESTWYKLIYNDIELFIDSIKSLLNLKDMLEAFLRHRREVVTRRTVYLLRKARERGHVLEGLAVAISIQ